MYIFKQIKDSRHYPAQNDVPYKTLIIYNPHYCLPTEENQLFYTQYIKHHKLS